MAAPRYGMVTDIRNMPAYSQLAAAGVTPLFGGNDPGGIAAIQAAMAAAQGNAGLWIPADSRGVQEYVDHVKRLMAAAPQAKHIDLNIEAIAKGVPGTPQWDYPELVLQQLAPYLQGRSWSVSPMGAQDDFNYAAAVSRGGQIWPQAYHGNMDPMDPQSIVNWVARNKVPTNMITPLLGSAAQGGFGHLYGIDLPGFRGPAGQLLMSPNANPLLGETGTTQSTTQLGAAPAPVRHPGLVKAHQAALAGRALGRGTAPPIMLRSPGVRAAPTIIPARQTGPEGRPVPRQVIQAPKPQPVFRAALPLSEDIMRKLWS